MVLYAQDLLAQQQEQLPLLTRIILQVCVQLDDWGAWQWQLRTIGLVTAIVLSGARLVLQKKRGVDWYALIHALITAVGSLACYYLDVFMSETLTGTPEPLRMCQCQGPMTSLHRILPAITMGYAIFDLVDGLTIGIDFAIHGVATLAVFLFFCEINLPEAMASAQVMEVSTVFLSLIRADFFSSTLTMGNMALFGITFFIFRIIAMPYIWGKLMLECWRQSTSEVYQSCFPSYFLPVAFSFGILFHALDLFWFYKIVKKIQRKLGGSEKLHESNHLPGQEMEADMKKSQ